MAKQPVHRGGTTKVRFLMLEAEGAESDLTQIFSAIQSAVKPSATVIQQRLVPGPAGQPIIDDAPNSVDEACEELEADVISAPSSPKPAKPRIARKPTTPDVLDFDFDSDTSLKEFADRCTVVDSDVERYLVIAAWFKEGRDIAAVTTSHIYTSYRKLGWPSAIEDFGAVLRYLKSQKLMGSGGRGEYIINHLGLDRVRKLAAA